MWLPLIALLAFLSSAGLANAASFDPIGLIGPTGISYAYGVSDDGNTVVGTDTGTWAFVWTRAAGLRALPRPAGVVGSNSAARAVSADGRTIVGSATGYVESISAELNQPVVWQLVGDDYEVVTPSEVAARGLQPGFPYHYELVDVSDDGLVLVGNAYWAGGLPGFGAFRWDAVGGFVGFSDLRATAASGSGAVLAAHRGYNYGDVLRLPAPSDPIAYGLSHGVSADGAAVVGYAFEEGNRAAFRWTAGAGRVLLGTLGADPDSEAFAATADGSTVVGVSGNAPPNLEVIAPAGFIWDEAQGMRSLQSVLEQQLGHVLVGWTELAPRAISADGSAIAGSGRNANGDIEPFVARLPETTADIASIAAFLGLAIVRRLRGARTTPIR